MSSIRYVIKHSYKSTSQFCHNEKLSAISHFSYMLKQVCWILPLTLPFFPWTTDNCSRSVFFLLIFFYEYAKAPLSIRSDRRLQQTVQSLDTHVNKSLREVKGIPHAHWFRLLYWFKSVPVYYRQITIASLTPTTSPPASSAHISNTRILTLSTWAIKRTIFKIFNRISVLEFKKLHTSDSAK